MAEQPLELSSGLPDGSHHDQNTPVAENSIKDGIAPDRPAAPIATLDPSTHPITSITSPDSPSHISDPYIFTTVRYDPDLINEPLNTAASCNIPSPIYMLEHHWTRLRVASWSTRPQIQDAFSSCQTPALLLQGLLAAVRKYVAASSNPSESATQCLRVKLRRYTTGRITIEIGPTAKVSMETLFPSRLYIADGAEGPKTDWTCVLDSKSTEATESTMYKTSDRYAYVRARADAGIETLMTPKEVLLWTPGGRVLDGSINTPYFLRGGRWVTQGAGTEAGLQGTTRRWALERGLVCEAEVMVGSCRVGETVWFSNAVKGFFPVILVAREEGKS